MFHTLRRNPAVRALLGGLVLLGAAALLLALRGTPNPVALVLPALAPPAPAPPDTALQHRLRTQLTDSAAAHPHLGAYAQVQAFYARRNFAPAWHGAAGQAVPLADSATQLLTRAAAYGLDRRHYHFAALQALRDSLPQQAAPNLGQQARTELLLTDAMLQVLAHVQRGRMRATAPPAPGGPEPTGPVAGLQQALQEQGFATVLRQSQPANREYRQLQAALASWLSAQQQWEPAELWQQPQFSSAAFSLERWRQEPISDTAYVLINLPAYELQVISQGRVVATHRVVIGKPETPSPTLSSRIGYFTTAPDWYVPRSIATREILPRLQRNPGYLAEHNYALYSEQGAVLNPYSINWQQVSAARFPYLIRQSAGCDNALGNVVFRFANPYAVYLHDTPAREAFRAPERAFSHGCIRLEHPMQFAAYLLQREGRSSAQLPSEAECARQPRPRHYHLRKPLPIHIRYATGAAEGGELRTYADVYGRDARLARLWATRPLQ
ncbi:L,D-transpeptidase scaffold domain-containing protein [Hymenobacter latericus]|uniref:L,D-transpeptidase family protein n=1 Tax=Hymenobacter sp. YIM 151858-1 TaxID=2987688 RepID=UPI002226F2AD|nr:L,D-transpeptidase family protein [Hymenobacter sp. YIM 151858-1]UYZ59708.1 L,D-transpeptidase family protein [Hymenobacter sp. YIM 151858-1]